MAYALEIIICIFVIMLFVSRASEPSMVVAEQVKTQSAEATVTVLKTQVAYYRPTPQSCANNTQYYPYICGK